MKLSRVLAVFAVAAAATLATAPAAQAIIGPCDDHHDIEVHVASGQCVQADYPR